MIESISQSPWSKSGKTLFSEGTTNPQVTFTGTLSLPGGTVTAEGDLWIIEGEEFRVKTPGFVDPSTGRLELEMVRADRKVVRNVPGQITLRKGFS